MTRHFDKFAKENGIEDALLIKAVEEIEAGKEDAALGGGVYKQRIARRGHGKRGSFRTIVLFKMGDKAFFVDGFAKSNRANISKNEVLYFKQLAKDYFGLSEKEIALRLSRQMIRRIL